jgi:uncharacterized protein (TIGR03435 family)
MNKLALMIAVTAFAGSGLQAQKGQKLTGAWQGTLKNPAGQQLRIVVKVSLEDDKLKAVLHSIDQQPGPIPASTITLDGTTIKMTIVQINGTFQGKLSADGNMISGTWTQGGPPAPLDLARATSETAWAIPEPPPPPPRMAANADPSFDVATIKPSNPSRPGRLFTLRGADVITINTTLSDLITFAYELHPKQIVKGPAWLESEKFDLDGRPDVPGQPNLAQAKVMVQKLLAHRFQLKFHREKREFSVYALTVVNGGPKFAKSERDPNSPPGLLFRGPGTNLNGVNTTMTEFASLLQRAVLDKPVVDQTGLKEKYDFILKWTPDPGQLLGLGGTPPPAPDTGDAPPDLFTALQQQLGLKLESARAPADVLVIDHVERPSEN